MPPREHKLYLHLVVVDSNMPMWQRQAADAFSIDFAPHADYWMSQAFPVMLVIRTPEGEVRWEEVSERLGRQARLETISGQLREERFDVMSVRRWRDQLLKD